jgi:hypothetical protein
MAAYKNSYKKEEDITLWELHEIRYRLHKESKGKTIEQINEDALQKFSTWGKTSLKAPANDKIRKS